MGFLSSNREEPGSTVLARVEPREPGGGELLHCLVALLLASSEELEQPSEVKKVETFSKDRSAKETLKCIPDLPLKDIPEEKVCTLPPETESEAKARADTSQPGATKPLQKEDEALNLRHPDSAVWSES